MGFHVISCDVKIAAVRLYECGLLNLEDILDCCGFLCHTWFRVLKLWHETGDVMPDKLSLQGHVCNLDQEDLSCLLELIHDNPNYFLDELLHLLETNHFISVHYTTIFHELECLNVSQKKLKKIALEWDEEHRADFVARMVQYNPEELGFIDEMSKDACSIGRHYGRSWKNRRAHKRQPFFHGQCTSTEALLTLDGIVAGMVVEGLMTKELFLDYLEHILPKCSAYPGPLSVLGMDNAHIHHGNEILELCDHFGVRVEYLPPYSPDLNPIEEVFSKIKHFLRRYQDYYLGTTDDGILYDMYEVMDIITPEDTAGYFGHAGYF